MEYSVNFKTTTIGNALDISLIQAAVSSINVAKELGKAALGVRDFNEFAPTITALNDQLLKAQEALFRHNTQLLAMQNEQFETAKELTKLKETVAQKGRYTLFELSKGILVYRVNIAPVDGHVGDPVSPEPLHYVCQPCFDKGVKVVLQRAEHSLSVNHVCSGCKMSYLETKKPAPAPVRQTLGPNWTNSW